MQVRENFKPFLGSHGIVSFLLLAATLVANSFILQASPFDKRHSFNDTYRITPDFLKLISAGYWPAVTDFLWLRGISNLGFTTYTQENFAYAYESYDLGTKLDPDFYEMYEQAGVSFSYFFENTDASLEFLNRGIARYERGGVPPKFWTHPYTLYIHAAYTYAYLKNDWASARQMFLRAAKIPGTPQYILNAQGWMKDEKNERILAIRVLKSLIRNTRDETIRAKYEQKLKQYEP